MNTVNCMGVSVVGFAEETGAQLRLDALEEEKGWNFQVFPEACV